MKRTLKTMTVALSGVALGLVMQSSLVRPANAAERPPAKNKSAPPATDAPTRIQSEEWPQRAPKLIGSGDDWLNTDSKPLQIEKGKVYLVDFFEYTCVNCLRTLPYLQEWNKRYAKDGLVIIGIHTPEFDFAKDKANVAQAVKRLGITWPVVVDSKYENWNAYRNSFWPRKYFVDAKGRIVADHAGEGGYEESEARIQKLLKQANPKVKFPKVMGVVRDTDKPGAVCYPVTPEIYAGARGAETGQHGNISDYAPGNTAAFNDADTSVHPDGRIFLNGKWTTERESLRYAETGTPEDKGATGYAALKYHALEANAVLKPEGGKPFRVYITQDDKPIAKTDAGDDIRYDESGSSYLQVDEPRMYRLTKNAKFGSHELRLLPKSADFGLYSFTFSSCQVK